MGFAVLLILAPPVPPSPTHTGRSSVARQTREQLRGQGRGGPLRGSGLKAACVVWWPKLLRLLRFWAHCGEECHEMNDGCLFLWGGTLASSGSGWGWHAALGGMPTCLGPVYTGKNSKSYLTPFTSLPSSCTHSS